MKPSCANCDIEMAFVLDPEIGEMFFQCPDCNHVLYDFDPEAVTLADILGDLE